MSHRMGVGNLRGGKVRVQSASFQCEVLDNQRGRKCEASELCNDIIVEHVGLITQQSLTQTPAWSLTYERKGVCTVV